MNFYLPTHKELDNTHQIKSGLDIQRKIGSFKYSAHLGTYNIDKMKGLSSQWYQGLISIYGNIKILVVILELPAKKHLPNFGVYELVIIVQLHIIKECPLSLLCEGNFSHL